MRGLKLFRIEALRPPRPMEAYVQADSAWEAWKRGMLMDDNGRLSFSECVVTELTDEPDLAESAARGRGRPFVVERADHVALAFCSSRDQAERIAGVTGGVVR